MTKIIKRDEKFYRQNVQEDEVHLDSLEENLIDIKRRKSKSIINLTKDFNDQIDEIQDEIYQMKSL